MHLRLRGERIPADLLELLAALTDGAQLRHTEVTHDPQSREVRLPITRFPLLKRRRLLPNIRDRRNPISSVVTVRNVVACDIDNSAPADLGHVVQLLFGLQVRDRRVYISSAEEDRGHTCFSVTLQLSGLDIEITDSTA
jgi:hypothetical protein